MPRLLEGGRHRLDDRHAIWSRVSKPGSRAHYRYHADLFPSGKLEPRIRVVGLEGLVDVVVAATEQRMYN